MKKTDDLKKKKTMRVQMELPSSMVLRMLDLKKRTEAVSIAEVVRKSLIFFAWYLKMQESGCTLVTKNAQGTVREIEFL